MSPTLARWLSQREASGVRACAASTRVKWNRTATRRHQRDVCLPIYIASDDELGRELLALTTRAASDLRADGLTARTVTVRVRDFDFKTRSASRTLDAPVISDRVILEVGRQLLAKLREKRRVPARLLGVALSSLTTDSTGPDDAFRENATSASREQPRPCPCADRRPRRAKFGDRHSASPADN
jgi:hypothetical protein